MLKKDLETNYYMRIRENSILSLSGSSVRNDTEVNVDNTSKLIILVIISLYLSMNHGYNKL